MATNDRKDIIFILDESGSMESMGKEPIDSTNYFIKEQRDVNSDATFTLYKFNNIVRVVYNDVPLTNVGEFTDYKPSNMTALYDGIGHAIVAKKGCESNKNVICVILTDGQENSSITYTCKDVKKMVKEMETDYGWTFIYLGANQDAMYEGGKVGISCCENFMPTQCGLVDITRQVSATISSLRSGTSSIKSKKDYSILTINTDV